jgi:hypothetical protein
MNFKNTLLFIFMLITGFKSVAQNPCGCPINDNEPLICAQDGFGSVIPLPNECIATCLGFTIVDDSLCFSGPWSECNCEIDENEPEICVQFDGYTFKVPNECIADCKGFTIVADSLCDTNPFDCMCPFDSNEPWICAKDSLGNICSAPNACYAACWGLTEVPCGETIDWGTITCTEDLVIDGDMLFQEILLMLNQACDIELPECVLTAPLFGSDSLFMDYLLNNCDLLEQPGSENGPTLGEIYSFYRSISTKTIDYQDNLNTSIQLMTNPVSDKLLYSIESKINTNAQITLFDLRGQIIFSNNVSLTEGKYSYETDISSVREGMYMLSLGTQFGQQTLKVVILKQ